MPRVLDISVPNAPASHLWPGHQPCTRTLLGDMKLVGSDGAPARAVLLPPGGEA